MWLIKIQSWRIHSRLLLSRMASHVKISEYASFKNLSDSMNNTLVNYAPFKKITKYKLKFRTKPWITPVFSIWCLWSHLNMSACLLSMRLEWRKWKKNKRSNWIANHFLTSANFSQAWMLYFHAWVQNKGKVWSKYKNQFGIPIYPF